MRLFAIILSVYFLALNVVPCSDADIVTDNQVTVAADNGVDHGHASSDLCSPFCMCHCCHTHTVNFTIFTFEPFQPLISQEELAHFDSLGKDIFLDLLQPPRA
ncbi:hypothetical protein D9O36_09175 [Zobellia amurskyensis]|uniref:Uncharacterized protein n=1 Tax=Zobellia amurskyensis TaxID=248905 RepID=A0A7X2ZTB5_9FLAO|nr:hypothetical protein [Zobellia amurskyensis]